ncbi:MAG: AI-2E family transporter [Vicinamibacteraceae bacterium]|nr:AI-2E family transporter [Vicinamibacteraceae bacterium]
MTDLQRSRGAAPDLRTLAARAAVVTLSVVAVVAVTALFVLAAKVWLLMFAGLLVAVLLSAAADAVSRWSGLGRGLSLAAAVIALVLIVVTAALALWPSVSDQVDQLATALPAAVRELRAWMADRAWGEWLLGRADPGQVVRDAGVVGQATGALMSTASAIGGLVLMLFVGIYGAAQPDLYRRGVLRLVPVGARGRIDHVLHEVVGVLRWWMVGKVLSMTVVGVLTTAGLWLLGVPLALTFGLIAALLTFVPNFGPILSVVPPLLLALVDEPRLAAYVVLLYLAIQTVESYAITPLIQRKTVSMPPALTIAAQVVLGILVGAIGVAVATPLAAAAMTAVRLLYVEDLLERGNAAAGFTDVMRPSSG